MVKIVILTNRGKVSILHMALKVISKHIILQKLFWGGGGGGGPPGFPFQGDISSLTEVYSSGTYIF